MCMRFWFGRRFFWVSVLLTGSILSVFAQTPEVREHREEAIAKRQQPEVRKHREEAIAKRQQIQDLLRRSAEVRTSRLAGKMARLKRIAVELEGAINTCAGLEQDCKDLMTTRTEDGDKALLGASDIETKALKNLVKKELADVNGEQGNVSGQIEDELLKKFAGEGFQPMGAVLFAPDFDVDEFSVAQAPAGSMLDPNIGFINRERQGGIAGLLLAAEAPLGMLELFRSKIPVGGWFGVQLQTGDGTNVEDVGLAAGFSFIALSVSKLEELKAWFGSNDDAEAKVHPVRILLGVMYGEKTFLADGLVEGFQWPLADDVPTRTEGDFEFTFGLGFRF